MNDLNKLSVPVNAPGDYGVHDPQNAWPDAGSDVRVSMNFIGSYLVQFGYTVGTDVVWMRRRKASGQEPWSAWNQVLGDEQPAPPPPPPPPEPEEPEPEEPEEPEPDDDEEENG